MRIYDATERYAEGAARVGIVGEDYRRFTGVRRQSTRLLGMRAVIARRFEHIREANLIGMGSCLVNV